MTCVQDRNLNTAVSGYEAAVLSIRLTESIYLGNQIICTNVTLVNFFYKIQSHLHNDIRFHKRWNRTDVYVKK